MSEFKVKTNIEGKEVLFCQQFHLLMGESFTFNISIDDAIIKMKFTQEFNPKNAVPYLKMLNYSQNEIHYLLGNFNQHQVTSEEIRFFSERLLTREKKEEDEFNDYSFRLSATRISPETNSQSTWLYAITFFKREFRYEKLK